MAASPGSAAIAVRATAGERMEAIAKLWAQPGSMARDHALAAALLKLDAADFSAGAEAMQALFKRSQRPDDLEAEQLAEAWMDRWLELDTPGALRFLSSTPFLAQLPVRELVGWPIDEKIHCAQGGILAALARRQPEWTQQALAETPSGSVREIGVYALLKEVAKGDAARTARFLASFANGADRAAALTGYVTALVDADIRSGYDKASAEPPGMLRENLLRLVFARAGERGVSTARDLLDQIDDPAMRRQHAPTALLAIGFDQREDALPFIIEESERMAATSGWNTEDARDWASSVDVAARGPQARAFAEWAAGFEPDADRKMFGQIVIVWAGREPATFRNWLKEHAETLDAAAVKTLDGALANLARRDLPAARTWSETLPAGALRDQARFQVALASGAEGDVAHAATAYRSVAGNDTKGALAGQLAKLLAQHDGAAAADWALTQPVGPARTAALAAVAETWSERDPHGAAGWLEQMPAGAERDSALQKYATRVVVADPESAAQWVGQMADPTLRIATAEAVFNRWHIQNPVAARAWLRSLPGMEGSKVAKSIRNRR